MSKSSHLAFASSLSLVRVDGGKSSSFVTPTPSHGHSTHATTFPRKSLQSQKLLITCNALSTKEAPKLPLESPNEDIPVQHRIPFLSDVYDVLRRNIPTVTNGKRYGDVYETSTLGSAFTVVTDLEEVVKAYRDGKTFLSKDANIPSLTALFGESSMVVLDGVEHMKKRSVVQPAFSPQMFSLYFDTMALAAGHLWDHVSAQLQSRKSMTLSDVMKQHYLRITICITTGKKLSSDLSSDTSIAPLGDAFMRLTKGFIALPWTPMYSNAIKARDYLLDTFKSLIRERIETCAEIIGDLRQSGEKMISAAKQGLKSGNFDILTVAIASSSLPLGSSDALNEEDLEDLGYLMLLLWFAGYTTQATTTMSSILEMHFQGNIKDQLIAEQEAIISEAGDRTVTYDQVARKMPLLDSFISEVMRLYPAAPLLSRKVSADVDISGYRVKKGKIVALDLWTAQRDAKYYEDPEVLKIDRFLGSKHPLPHEIVSFGASGGPHFCLGAALAKINMKVTLSTLLRYFDIELDPSQSREHVLLPEVQPMSGVKVSSCKRKQL